MYVIMYVPQLFGVIIAQQFFSPFQCRPTTRTILMNKTPLYLNENLGTAKKVFLCVCVNVDSDQKCLDGIY